MRIKWDENKLLGLKFSQDETNARIVYNEVTLMAMWAVPQLHFIKNSAAFNMMPDQQTSRTALNSHPYLIKFCTL